MPAVAFVINGTLTKAKGHFRDLCHAAARRANWTAEFFVTEKADAGVTAARDAADRGADLVVAVGGDGTVRGCAEGLAGTPVPLAIVPLGTANLLARTLGIPSRPGAALAVALAASTARATAHQPVAVDRMIDLATADGAPFTAMAGMGLDAAVVAATRLKHHLGWVAYRPSCAA